MAAVLVTLRPTGGVDFVSVHEGFGSGLPSDPGAGDGGITWSPSGRCPGWQLSALSFADAVHAVSWHETIANQRLQDAPRVAYQVGQQRDLRRRQCCGPAIDGHALGLRVHGTGGRPQRICSGRQSFAPHGGGWRGVGRPALAC